MRAILAVVVVAAVVAGWLVTSGVSAQTQSVPDPGCRYEIYGPVGADSGWTAYSRVNEPVILLDQCTGLTWQFPWDEGSASEWRPIGVRQ